MSSSSKKPLREIVCMWFVRHISQKPASVIHQYFSSFASKWKSDVFFILLSACWWFDFNIRTTEQTEEKRKEKKQKRKVYSDLAKILSHTVNSVSCVHTFIWWCWSDVQLILYRYHIHIFVYVYLIFCSLLSVNICANSCLVSVWQRRERVFYIFVDTNIFIYLC